MQKEKDHRLFVYETIEGRMVYKIPAHFEMDEKYYVKDIMTDKLYVFSGFTIEEIISTGIELE